jgi:hypothetical protein
VSRFSAFCVQHHSSQTPSDAVGTISFSFLTQLDQPAGGTRMQTQQSRKHGHPQTGSMPQFAGYVPFFMRGCIAKCANPSCDAAFRYFLKAGSSA